MEEPTLEKLFKIKGMAKGSLSFNQEISITGTGYKIVCKDMESTSSDQEKFTKAIQPKGKSMAMADAFTMMGDNMRVHGPKIIKLA